MKQKWLLFKDVEVIMVIFFSNLGNGFLFSGEDEWRQLVACLTNYVQVGEGWCFTMHLLSSCKKLSLGVKEDIDDCCRRKNVNGRVYYKGQWLAIKALAWRIIKAEMNGSQL